MVPLRPDGRVSASMGLASHPAMEATTMRRTIQITLLALIACTLSGCVSSSIASARPRSTQVRSGDSLGHAMFAKRNDQSRFARAESR